MFCLLFLIISCLYNVSNDIKNWITKDIYSPPPPPPSTPNPPAPQYHWYVHTLCLNSGVAFFQKQAQSTLTLTSVAELLSHNEHLDFLPPEPSLRHGDTCRRTWYACWIPTGYHTADTRISQHEQGGIRLHFHKKALS